MTAVGLPGGPKGNRRGGGEAPSNRPDNIAEGAGRNADTKRVAAEGSGLSKTNSPERFVSGTLVKTSGGLIPIERVKVGMLAWALDVETGEWGTVRSSTPSRAGAVISW